jgi:micrococcal nuclease
VVPHSSSALAALAALVLSVAGCTAGGDRSSSSTVPVGSGPLATVERVVDGDTVIVDFDGGPRERVRLIGIDTPESVKPDTPVECFGKEASAFTASLLPEGTVVSIERDVEPRDDYGRLLGYVHREADGLFVNEEIVERGYARPLTIPPNVAHTAELVAAARRAEAADRGLWASCRG